MGNLKYAPDRGRIIMVNFELSGSQVPLEMTEANRPCVVIQNNKINRGHLVTVVPLSTSKPKDKRPFHHLMDHRSFWHWPVKMGGRDMERWAKCDCITTVSLDRCKDPSMKDANNKRRYLRIKAINSDLIAIERCILWALGISIDRHAGD